MASQAPVETRERVDLRILGPSDEIREGITLRDLPVTTTISDLRRRIQETLSSHPDPPRQRLIHRGRALLLDDTTLLEILGEASIQEQSVHTIHLVIQESENAHRRATPIPHQQPGRVTQGVVPLQGAATPQPRAAPPGALNGPQQHFNGQISVRFSNPMELHQHMVNQAQQQMHQSMLLAQFQQQQMMAHQTPPHQPTPTSGAAPDAVNPQLVQQLNPNPSAPGLSSVNPVPSPARPITLHASLPNEPSVPIAPNLSLNNEQLPSGVNRNAASVPHTNYVQHGPQVTHFSFTTGPHHSQPINPHQQPVRSTSPGLAHFPQGIATPSTVLQQPGNNPIAGEMPTPLSGPGIFPTPHPGVYPHQSINEEVQVLEGLVQSIENSVNTSGIPMADVHQSSLMRSIAQAERHLSAQTTVAGGLSQVASSEAARHLQLLRNRVEQLGGGQANAPAPTRVTMGIVMPGLAVHRGPTGSPAVQQQPNPSNMNTSAALPNHNAPRSEGPDHQNAAPNSSPSSVPDTSSLYLLNNSLGEPSAILVGPTGNYSSPTLPSELLSVMLASRLPMEQITSVFSDVMREAMQAGGFLFDHHAHARDNLRRQARAEHEARRTAAQQGRRMMQRAGVSSGQSIPRAQAGPANEPIAPEHVEGLRNVDDLLAQNRTLLQNAGVNLPDPAAIPNQQAANVPNLIAHNEALLQNQNANRVAGGPNGQAPMQPARAPDEMRDILAPIVRNLWLIIRIVAIIWFFASGGRGYGQAMLLGTAIALVYAIQNGVLVLPRGWAERLRGWWAGLLDPAQAQQAAQGHGAYAGVDAPEPGWRRRIRGVERAAALFFASLVPGLGEGYVQQVEARAARAAEANQAEAAQPVTGPAQFLPVEAPSPTSATTIETTTDSSNVSDHKGNQEIANSSTGVELRDSEGLTRVNQGKGKARAEAAADENDPTEGGSGSADYSGNTELGIESMD